MRVIDPGYEIMHLPEGKFILSHLELAGRTCYKSEDKITESSAATLLKALIRSGHDSVLEHVSITIRFICDRGITHELVRHRLASFSQESTRYANYAKDRFGSEITVIRPFFWEEGSEAYDKWTQAMGETEAAYLALLEMGAKPQEARSVLPNSLKTDIVTTANIREWRHIFKLRCAAASHPQIRQLMLPLLDDFHRRIPVLFDDLYETFADAIAEYREKAPIKIY